MDFGINETGPSDLQLRHFYKSNELQPGVRQERKPFVPYKRKNTPKRINQAEKLKAQRVVRKERLVELVKDKTSFVDIVAELKVTEQTIQRYAKELGIEQKIEKLKEG